MGELRRIECPSGAEMMIEGRAILNFGGSSYLGLTRQPELTQAAISALRDQGPLAQLPRHYGFALGANLDVEQEAARFFGCEAAMYFATGYLFGLIGLSGLSESYDIVFLDESAHYNLRDGALAAGKPVHAFRHRCPDDLAQQIRERLPAGARPLVATDGMFPTFGSVAPLDAYAAILRPHAGWLLVDESHAFGVLGPSGRGAVEHHAVQGPRVVAGGSLGKAFCAYGGLALGERTVVDRLWSASAARGAASGMSSGAAMSAASLNWVRRNPARLAKLRVNVKHLKCGLKALGLEVDDGEAPVAAFVAGSAGRMKRLQAELFDAGFYVIYSTYVGAGPAGAIRCAAFADHEPGHIDQLLGALAVRL
jgi:7-keto-8-aminopelargonate synthetase-like enzyme